VNAAARRVLTVVLLGVVPLAFGVGVLQVESHWGLFAFDFKGALWEPARAILHGESPYSHPIASEMDTGNPSVYPPVALWLAVPFALLPLGLAQWVWAAVLVAAVVSTLWLLHVRDWRCYTLTLGSCPIVFGLALGNVVTLLLPLAAVVWRRREQPWAAGAALGAAIAIKLVLWPLAFWLLAARRVRTAAVATAWAAASTLIAWAAIGFAGFRDYPDLLSVNTDLYATHSWSLLAGGVGLGLPRFAAGALMWLVGSTLLGASLTVTRRGREREGFCLAMIASLALLPIVWIHSLVVLVVPLAVVARSLNRQWLAFLALWLTAVVPRPLAHVESAPDGVPGAVWSMHHSPAPTAQIALIVVLVGLMTYVTLRRRDGALPFGIAPPPARS
jgi:hypothetical protein